MSDEAPIVIRVGAALDASVERSFATVEKRGTKAATALEKAAAKQAVAEQRAAAKRVAEAEKAAAKQEASATKLAGRQEALGAKSAAAAEKAAQRAAAAQIRETNKVAAAVERAAAREAAAQDRASRRALDRFAMRTSRYAVRAAIPYIPLATGARRVASSIARGLGVDLDFGDAMQRNAERQTLATALSNSGFQEGNTGPNGKRVAAEVLEREARTAGKRSAIDSTDILQGQRSFVGVTGDLNMARKLMGGPGGLAEIAQATTSDINDVSRAAAKISTSLEDTPDKAERVLAIVRLLAGQGKLGAAEMADYAKSVGQIAGTATRFGGDRTQNIAQLSALAQLSVQHNFNKSPQQAATGIASFANMFDQAATIKRFAKEFNVTPAVMEKRLKKMSPKEIIEASLRQTKGDTLAMGTLFKDKRARSVVLDAEKTFNEATGGRKDKASIDAGIAAVDAALGQLTNGAMSEAEIQKELASKLNTTAAQAKIFQMELDDASKEVESALLPALKELRPHLVEFAHFLANVAKSAIEHPKLAIAGAAMGAIGLAALKGGLMGLGEMAIGSVGRRLGFGGAASAAAAAAESGGVAAAGGGLLGAAGRFVKPTVLGRNVGAAGFGLAAAAATAGVMAAKDQNDQLKSETEGMGAFDIIGGMISDGTWNPFKVVDKHQNELAKQRAKDGTSNQVAANDDISLKTFSDQQSKENSELRKEIVQLRSALQTGTLSVRVTNPGGLQPGRGSGI